MQFTPIVKRKKYSFSKQDIPLQLFPKIPSNGTKYTGIFTGFSVEITEPSEIISIYENGCFGKGSRSRGSPKIVRMAHKSLETKEETFKESLVLDLEEAFFLSYYLELLKIINLDENEMEFEDVLKAFEKIKPNFVDCFAGYLYLKSKNWIVKSGMKFGGTFLLYKNGPRYFHASFIVFVKSSFQMNEANRAAKDIQGFQRIAETSDKDILFLEVTRPAEINSIEDFNNFTVSEMIIRRFNYSAFVSHN